jgi:D-alanyl-D-alanine carboxypeptidase
VRDLLRHTTTSVVHPWPHTELVDYATFIRNRFRTYTPHEIVAMSNALGFEEPEPGTAFSYNNTNYVLLGLVIERVTGRPYGTEVASRILRPLGLRHTEVPGTRTRLPEPHAHGY